MLRINNLLLLFYLFNTFFVKKLLWLPDEFYRFDNFAFDLHNCFIFAV
jgi:hypothetical protein